MDADATFILEDTKLKLIEDSPDMHRRQSLAPIASTAKMKVISLPLPLHLHLHLPLTVIPFDGESFTYRKRRPHKGQRMDRSFFLF